MMRCSDRLPNSRRKLSSRSDGVRTPTGFHHNSLYRRKGSAPGHLALPIYAELTEDQQAYVVETVKKFYGRN